MISETKHWTDRFSWVCRDLGSALHIRLEGELDMTSVRLGSAALREALSDHPQTIALDLGGLSFIDSAGLRLLIRAKREAEWRGGTLVITRLSQESKRLIELVGLSDWFDPDPSAELPSPPFDDAFGALDPELGR
ncbi:MAG: STAS domain-containing protein [Actinomycetota bacterium]